MRMEQQEPELKISFSGIVSLIIIFTASIILIILGHIIGNYGVMIWGYVFLMATTLSLLVVASRIFAYKAYIQRIKETEEKRQLEERIKKILQKSKQENETEAE